MSDKLLPPPGCFTRDEGAFSVVSARVVAGPIAIMTTIFVLLWSCSAFLVIAFVVYPRAGGQKIPMTVNGVPKEASFTDVLPFVIVTGLMALAGLLAALYLWFGKVVARVTHEQIELFTGVAGIGRRVRVQRNVVRSVVLRNSPIRVSGRPPLKVVELVGSDVTTGLLLGTSGREWFAQELRALLGLQATEK